MRKQACQPNTVLGIDPGAHTGLVLLDSAGNFLCRAQIAPSSRVKWVRLAALFLGVLEFLEKYGPGRVVVEGARTYPHKRSSTVSTIGAGENRGAVLTAVGRYVRNRPGIEVRLADAPDCRQGRYRRATKRNARLICRAKFGADVDLWSDDECDAGVLALTELEEL